MNILAIDGNSLVNRAFYGIKLLNAKDGHFTNAIFGFMNTFLNLIELTKPNAVIVAFDVREPTFRHKMYDAYKAGRKGMPAELFEQLEPLKRILKAYGCHIVECPGFEADDILGSVANSCKDDDMCFIATGDRDSLQLIKQNVSVLLTTTKMGKTQTTEYTPHVLLDEYGLTPAQMIELKALQGDSSDNIPGVPGIGPKTAGELIKQYGSIDAIYADINAVSVTPGVKQKLINGKDSAFLSRTLGTISFDAPINRDLTSYVLLPTQSDDLINELASHELFKIIKRIKSDEADKSEAGVIPDVSIKTDYYAVLYNDIISLNKIFENGKEFGFLCEFKDNNPKAIAVVNCSEIILFDENSDLLGVFSSTLTCPCKKYTCDLKQIYRAAQKMNISVNNISADIRLSAYLLNPNSSDYSIGSLCLSYGVTPPKPSTDNLSSDIINEFSAILNDAAAIKPLHSKLCSFINEYNQQDLLTDIELPLSEVLASMENDGIMVDKNGIEEYSKVLSAKAGTLEKEIYRLAGEEFNINSPKQLAVVLFEHMNLPAKKKTKTGYSTNADVLESLAADYPIVNKILEYRTLTKLKGTYCDGLIKAIDSDGRIRSTFNQTETRTGRLSSTEPNLQNIPVRTEVGKEFRKYFIAKPGFTIIDADYSQIELRVLAAVSDDKNMIEAFNNGDDIHTITASKVFGVPVNEVTHELRSKAKAVNFGIVYGIGAFSLAKDIKSTRSEADSFIKAYLSLYSSVDKYMKDSIVEAKKLGYVQTLFNRRRYLPELSSSNGMIRSFGERVARNMPIQGTAADIIKIAMIRVFNRLKKEMPQARLIMQVHDELMVEAPEEKAAAAAAILTEEMENCVQLKVRLRADAGIGKTWYEAKD